VITEPKGILKNFLKSLKNGYGLKIKPIKITHELCKAPVDRRKLKLPPDKGAVYVFSLSELSMAPAGPNRVLKVGKVGSKSLARFKYQHYKPGSANSTLAGSIKRSNILWEYIGIRSNIDTKSDFGAWLIENTDRDHFLMDASAIKVGAQTIYPLEILEIYLKGILGPIFEG